MGAREGRGLEAFRVAQHSRPLTAQRTAATPDAMAAAGSAAQPDSGRAILHMDVDAFYAQAEEVRDPSLRERPLGVTQKYLIVTCNYPARRAGVTKLMGITEARQKCPDLLLICGEDLTPYRAASRKIQVVLERFGTVERLGMDECFVDITDEVRRRLEVETDKTPRWSGHILNPAAQLHQDNPHRPQDLRAAPTTGPTGSSHRDPGVYFGESWWPILSMGSVIAQEARQMVKLDTGFRSSCGIASNKMLAKLISGLHKPDDQTIIFPPDARLFMSTLPARAIPGVGYKTSSTLKTKLGVESVQQLLGVNSQRLEAELGEAAGRWLWGAARGKDPVAVVAKGPPKSITVEDSFKDCSGSSAVLQVLRVLAPDLLYRLEEDTADYGRQASTLVVKWRHRGNGYHRTSASCPMPVNIYATNASPSEKVDLLVTASAGVLKRHLPPRFNLSLINIGATNLRQVDPDGKSSGMLPITRLWEANKTPTEIPSSPPEVSGVGSQGTPPARSLSARAAADMATLQRRNYSSGNAVLAALGTMSKHQEREAREQRPHLPDSSGVSGSPSASGHSSARDGPSCAALRPHAQAEVSQELRRKRPVQPPSRTKEESCPLSVLMSGRCQSQNEAPPDHTMRRQPPDVAGNSHGALDGDYALAMKLQQEEVDAFQRHTATAHQSGRSSRPGAGAGAGERGGKKQRTGPLDMFITRQSQRPP